MIDPTTQELGERRAYQAIVTAIELGNGAAIVEYGLNYCINLQTVTIPKNNTFWLENNAFTYSKIKIC